MQGFVVMQVFSSILACVEHCNPTCDGKPVMVPHVQALQATRTCCYVLCKHLLSEALESNSGSDIC